MRHITAITISLIMLSGCASKTDKPQTAEQCISAHCQAKTDACAEDLLCIGDSECADSSSCDDSTYEKAATCLGDDCGELTEPFKALLKCGYDNGCR